ncbi:MAG: preprotein translocase subunit SecE [Thermodesulfobacteriota bacterium]
MASVQDRSARSGKKPVAKEPEARSGFGLDRIKEFGNEVRSEFGKIVWPARKQTVATTGVVLLLVMLLSFYLGAVDLLLGKIIGYVLR